MQTSLACMARTTTDNPGKAAEGARNAVVFVHASGAPAIDGGWLDEVLALGFPVCSHRLLPGCQKTAHGYTQLGPLLAELGKRFPGRAIILLRHGLLPERRQLTDLAAGVLSEDRARVLTVLSNASPALNPFAGLEARRWPDQQACSRAVRTLGSGQRFAHFQWPPHLAALSPAAAASLASQPANPGNALSILLDKGGCLELSDRLYVGSQAAEPGAAPRLEPHETLRPPAWGALGATLQTWLDAGSPEIPPYGEDGKPVTLHITHSWGGGVAQWARTFIRHDEGSNHLQLVSEEPQSGQGYGQRLSLYATDRLDFPLASWWMQPPIQSVDDSNPQYAAILGEVRARYAAGRVLVSSLVGHALDALRTGLPTIQVLHDYFPVWPLLGVHPEAFAGADGAIDLAAALDAAGQAREFRDRGTAAWLDIRRAYLRAISEHEVRVVAPSRSVVALQNRLDAGWKDVDIQVIPHGFPPLDSSGPVTPRNRRDDRLRLVVPGRVLPGKGQRLLLEALPDLVSYAHVYLLGTGQRGEQFFGAAGVDVLIDYRREELPAILHGIGPHLAALLSVVPETFSYTLSELQHLGIPAIATRVGSLPERVEEGITGWLIEPTGRALVERVRALYEAPEAIDTVRQSLVGVRQETPAAMVEAYNRACPAIAVARDDGGQAMDPSRAQASSNTFLGALGRVERRRLERHNRELERTASERTRWALDIERALENEREVLRRLQEELAAGAEQLAQTRADYDQARADHEAVRQELDETNAVLDETHSALQTTLRNLRETSKTLEATEELQARILASTSWRITRPLRALRRAAGAFVRGRAWNPVRWPLLLARLVHNLATVGLRGTLMRVQYSEQAAPPGGPAGKGVEPVGDAHPPPALPRSARPEASIVVPAYNHWVYTAACLRSIAESDGAHRLEVILVDDASTDATQESARAVPGLRYIRNEENLGFIASCNRGAEEARGEFLVLLNNDTQVLEGWLEALLRTFRDQPGAGLVGAKLVYPDGRLQECGGLVFSDGSGWNFGRGDDPDRPQYQYLRETDYCSGACLVIRTELFRELGGFDTRFAPAYYEDTDLAFRVRDAGRQVFVQPRAVVIHHEGVTSGTDLDSGTKRYQLANQQKFVERWARALTGFAPRIEDPTDLAAVRKARDFHLRGRVLIIDATTPEPDQDSGSVRLTHLMGCFRELGYGVTFFADNRAHAGRYTRALQDAGVEVVYAPWLESFNVFFEERGAEFDFVLISRHYVAVNYISLVRRHCPQAAFIFDTVDLHYLREQRLAELENSLPLARAAHQTRRSELSVIAATDAVLVVSPAEVEVLAADAPDALVHVLSNIHPVHGCRAGFDERRDLFFVGGYQHPPNIDAMQWFVKSVWPLIRSELPDVKFHMIGSKAPRQICDLHGEGVVFHGYVEDLGRFLDGCRLAVAPLRYGAGVKGKVNLSMSHGQPVVATPIAVEGMNAEHGREILVAESERAFADEVVRLYRDETLWQSVSAAALENVERYFSVAAALRSLESLIQRLGR
jgi:GT2 family glycosyltransferase/glycosyltransferase involved in cell wall biosynthesis